MVVGLLITLNVAGVTLAHGSDGDAINESNNMYIEELKSLQEIKRLVDVSETSHTYSESSYTDVYFRPGFVTDIVLEPGEEILLTVGADTTNWTIERGISGEKKTKKNHVFVMPASGAQDTNIIITTDKRIYHINAKLAKNPDRIVSWKYN